MPRAGAPVVPLLEDRKVLERATRGITQSGMNSALDGSTLGVPMLAIPLASHGCGEVVRLDELTPEVLQRTTEKVLGEPQDRTCGKKLSAEIPALQGLQRPADLGERVIHSRAPVL